MVWHRYNSKQPGRKVCDMRTRFSCCSVSAIRNCKCSEMDPSKLIQDSHHFATNAVSADNGGNYKVAIFYYIEAAEAIKTALDIDNSLPSALHENAVKYLERAESLHRQCSKLNFIIIFLFQNCWFLFL